MAQRLNISIPDELNERIKAFKDILNISKICQVAIDTAVTREEARIGEDIKAAIVRVRKEKAEYFKVYRDEGFKDGKSDALSFAYEKFIKVISAIEEKDYKQSNSEEALYYFADEVYKGKAECIGDNQLVLDTEIVWVSFFDLSYEAADEYSKGWIDGVIFVWDQVKSKI
ncbi:MAG: hypothetical protein PHI97_34725 [Desulfobulbus sp.]|nr:hypothetical protein [Desulfobulbus sp.]